MGMSVSLVGGTQGVSYVSPWKKEDLLSLPFQKLAEFVSDFWTPVQALQDPGTSWVLVAGYGMDALNAFGSNLDYSQADVVAEGLRHRNCIVVIANSLSEVFELALKRHGILPLMSRNKMLYSRVAKNDLIHIRGVGEMFGTMFTKILVIGVVKHSVETVNVCCECYFAEHTLTPEQVLWLKAGAKHQM
jgi:aconitase A